MATAPVLEITEDGRSALTETDHYELRDPMPDWAPLPETARNAIFALIVRNNPALCGSARLSDIHAYIDQISASTLFQA